ncbi:DNA dC-_dU-editing enzyme APOBEC-3B-like [Myotis daubentonii]|uniref:DNA dC->dU-editing enzyme APOBEC-3B-like n=1 Tax=Myotis daubentonii TaxID=98922 RepID=UPI0028733A58|nr:DNA dC->dU-editing enzyme APOBEC-3B-like [Myotis daubentonii]
MDNRAPTDRPLMKRGTFKRNFRKEPKDQTYLCYEVEVRQGVAWVAVEGLQGIRRKRPQHLDRRRKYRLTWYISLSPCPDCVPKLVEFLEENRHVQLRIFAAHIHTKISGYEDGLRRLRDAGAELAIMTFEELQHCWEKFVYHGTRMQPLKPETELEKKLQKLKEILRLTVSQDLVKAPFIPKRVQTAPILTAGNDY